MNKTINVELSVNMFPATDSESCSVNQPQNLTGMLQLQSIYFFTGSYLASCIKGKPQFITISVKY